VTESLIYYNSVASDGSGLTEFLLVVASGYNQGMPRSRSGFGTSYHGSGAPIHWEKPTPFALADHDAVECVVALGFPVFPYEAYHTFLWSSKECRAIRIRRTPSLLLNAMLRPYLLACTIFAGGFCILLIVASVALKLAGAASGTLKPSAWMVLAIPLGAFLAGLGILSLLRASFRRSRDVRLVIGPHEGGSSDPASWFDCPSEELLLGQDLDSARRALDAGQFARAMFAARVLLARGDARGETLTDEILADSRVRSGLRALRRRPWLRTGVFPEDHSTRIPLKNRSWYATRGESVETDAASM
jgi:hypothetical protein